MKIFVSPYSSVLTAVHHGMCERRDCSKKTDRWWESTDRL